MLLLICRSPNGQMTEFSYLCYVKYTIAVVRNETLMPHVRNSARTCVFVYYFQKGVLDFVAKTIKTTRWAGKENINRSYIISIILHLLRTVDRNTFFSNVINLCDIVFVAQRRSHTRAYSSHIRTYGPYTDPLIRVVHQLFTHPVHNGHDGSFVKRTTKKKPTSTSL